MAECDIAKKALKVVIGQICQNIGWHAVQSSPMDILVDVLQRYIFEISKSVHQYSTQYNRTEPNLDDLGLTFKDFGIVLQEIEEYINNVEPVPPVYKVGSFPVKHPSNLQHPKPDSRELSLRPEHVPEYLPLMHPDEEDLLFSQQCAIDGVKKDTGVNGDCPSPLSSPKHGLKRHEWPSETAKKNSRFYSEEEGRPMREVTSVYMTPAGFVSPVNEGKLPDASLPCLVDSPPPSPEGPSHSLTPSSSKKEGKSKDLKKEKSKSKKDKKLGDSKKLKSSKKEKENKENSVSKHDKSITSSSSSKKDHSGSHKSSKSSNKSMKSDESIRQKSKGDKTKIKAQKDEYRKMKDKLSSKFKSKYKHSGGSGSSSHMKSAKKFKSSKLSKVKHLKAEKTKIVPLLPPTLPAVPDSPKEVVFEHKDPPLEEKEIPKDDDSMEEDYLDFREESPERLVIDDSLETQARQERESRLEVIDECIDAVIRRGEEESAEENQAMEDTINCVVKGPNILGKKLDIYDFTSSSSDEDNPSESPLSKKDKKSDSPKRSKKDKKKESKSVSPNPNSSPKSQKSTFALRVENRTPSPLLEGNLTSSDDSSPSSSPRSTPFYDNSPKSPTTTSLLSNVPPFTSGPAFTSSPFASVRNLPCHTNPNFPTPPLFVNNTKSESGSTFQNVQPLNLAKPASSSVKSSDKVEPNVPAKTENSDLIKKAANIIDKAKVKDHKKEKPKKKIKKEAEKVKEKKEEPKEKNKLKEKPKTKAEKKKLKLDKKKSKDEKPKDDSTVPKMTLKLSSGPGSTKIVVKPNTKTPTSLSSSPSPQHDTEFEEPASPPPAPRIPTPPPRSPTPEMSKEEEEEEDNVSLPPLLASKGSRGRGRGKKGASQPVIPPARTVITETLGTIVDESGNKIWICPACSRADDGSPMIGCDECDDWYHWVCVGIVVPPKEEESWFCVRCIAKRQAPKDKRKRKKHKKEK